MLLQHGGGALSLAFTATLYPGSAHEAFLYYDDSARVLLFQLLKDRLQWLRRVGMYRSACVPIENFRTVSDTTLL